jgi:hypothetical protein
MERSEFGGRNINSQIVNNTATTPEGLNVYFLHKNGSRVMQETNPEGVKYL